MGVPKPASVLLSSGPVVHSSGLVYGYLAYAWGFYYQLAISQSLIGHARPDP